MLFTPQHQVVPPVVTPHDCPAVPPFMASSLYSYTPTVTVANANPPVTATGVALAAVPPLPSWPY